MNSKHFRMTTFLAPAVLFAQGANAQPSSGSSQTGSLASPDFASMASDMGGQVLSLSVLMTVIAFIMGVMMVIGGLYKFKKHSDNRGDPSSSPAVGLMLVFLGAALVALPELMGVGVTTIFGRGGDTVINAAQPRAYFNFN